MSQSTLKYEIRDDKLFKITEQEVDLDRNPEEAVKFSKWSIQNPPKKGGRPKDKAKT